MKNKINYKYQRIHINLKFKLKNKKFKNKRMSQQDYRVQKILGEKNKK